MWQAVTRHVANAAEPLDPSEAITLDEALAGYTTGARTRVSPSTTAA